MRSVSCQARVLVILLAASPASAATLTRGPYLQLVGTDDATIVWNTDVAAECTLAIRRQSGGPATVVPGPTGTVCAIPVTGLASGTIYGYTPRADGRAGASRSSRPTIRRAATFLVG
jgi:hypothetical protein